MIAGLFSAISGLSAQQARLDTAANNIANGSSTAYKGKSVILTSAGENLGVQVVGTQTNFLQGALRQTGRPTDLAISGEGYFRVEDTNGRPFYTRGGNFTKDVDGYLRAAGGEYLLGDGGRVQISANAVRFSIGSDGEVSSVDEDGNVTTLGTIDLAMFGNPQGLEHMGNGLYTTSQASGPPTVANPGSGGAGMLQSGSLEMSNVDYVSEMVTMMTSQRMFEANVKSIQIADEMLMELMRSF